MACVRGDCQYMDVHFNHELNEAQVINMRPVHIQQQKVRMI